MRSIHLLIAASIFAAAPPVSAVECGVNNTKLSEPFTGHWRGSDGDTYDIAPGTLDRTFTIHLKTGDETRHASSNFVAAYDGEDPSQSAMDCRELTATERESIEQALMSVAPLDTSDRSHREIEAFHGALSHPPYPMMAVTYYEDQQWLIFISRSQFLDVWYGEGDFSVRVFKRVPVKNKQ